MLILCLASGYFPFYVALVLAYALAGLPCGWHALSAIQPRMFLFLPIIGWVIYFVIKFFLSYCVGLVAMPVQIVKAFKAARTPTTSPRFKPFAAPFNLATKERTVLPCALISPNPD